MQDLIERNRRVYNVVAREYSQRESVLDANNRRIANLFGEYLDEAYSKGASRDLSLLDVGVGSGLDLSIFHEKGYRTFGIDFSLDMIAVARKTSPQSHYILGNFLNPPFDGHFSGIYAQAFIHLFPKRMVPGIFEKMYALLEPSGLIHFSTTIHPKPSERWEEKGDYTTRVKRFRKRWTLDELNTFVNELSFVSRVHQYLKVDPFGKQWVNVILGH